MSIKILFGVPLVGVHSKKGEALLAATLPRIEYGCMRVTRRTHAELCAVLDENYPLAAGAKHKGEFVFGVPVIIF